MRWGTGDVIPLSPTHLLRPWQADDVDAVLAVFQDPDVVQRDAGWRDGSRASWAVTDDGGAVVGSFALAQLDLASAPFPPVHAAVSYMLLPAGGGQGIASVGVAAVCDWLLRDRGLHRVQLHHDIANTASCAVAQRCGFALEGTLRQALRVVDGWTDEHLHARIL